MSVRPPLMSISRSIDTPSVYTKRSWNRRHHYRGPFIAQTQRNKLVPAGSELRPHILLFGIWRDTVTLRDQSLCPGPQWTHPWRWSLHITFGRASGSAPCRLYLDALPRRRIPYLLSNVGWQEQFPMPFCTSPSHSYCRIPHWAQKLVCVIHEELVLYLILGFVLEHLWIINTRNDGYVNEDERHDPQDHLT